MPRIRRVAIVGGGVAGLSAACALALRGVSVDLYEANDKAGGCCATTRIGGYTLNDGALFLTLHGMLDHLFRRLELDRQTLVPLQRIAPLQRTVLPDGSVVTFNEADGISIEGRGEAATARARGELQRFLEKWDPLLRLFADDILLKPLSMGRLIAKGWRHLGRLRGTAESHLRRDFSDDAVRAAMAGTLLYTGIPPGEAPGMAMLGLAAMFREGYFIPLGGMGAIPEALAAAVRERGGRTRFGAKVTRILVGDGRARGIEVEGEGPVEADAVISTVSAMHTFGSLLARSDVPARADRKARRAVLSHKGFAVQLGLSNRIDVASYANYTLPFLGEQRELLAHHPGGPRWPIFMVPTVALPGLAPPGGSIVEMFPPIPQDQAAADWTRERKEEVAQRAIERLAGLHTIDLAVLRVRSPRDFQDEAHLYAGALYGLAPLAGPGAMFAHRTAIRGLYQAGQTTWPGFGVASAGLSGLMAAEALLRD